MPTQRTLDTAIAMSRGPRTKHPRLAAGLALLLLLGLTAMLLIVALDGRPVPVEGDESEILVQPLAIEIAILLWWLLLPLLAMWTFGVRTRGGEGEPLHFASLPGGRLTVSYIIWLPFASMIFALLFGVCGSIFSTPADTDGFSGGAPEAFGWLFIRGMLSIIVSFVFFPVLFIGAIVAHAIVMEVRRLRGRAARHEVAKTRFTLALTVVVTFVLVYAIALILPVDRTVRMVTSTGSALLIVGGVLMLFGVGRRAAGQSAATGEPDWTTGTVDTGLSKGQVIGATFALVVLLGSSLLRVFG